MSFMGFGRKIFGHKNTGLSQPSGGFSGGGDPASGSAPFDRHFAQATILARGSQYPASGSYPALQFLSPEERGELLVDLIDQPGIYDGFGRDISPQEAIAYNTMNAIWQTEIAVRAEHLGGLLTLLTGNNKYRKCRYSGDAVKTLLRLIDSAIKQGAYLSSGDCAALAQMASDIRNAPKGHSNADTKQLIARAERIEKLAGVKVSATEFLLQRCEGAENPFAVADKPRPNAQFWADLFAEVTTTLNEIRMATMGSAKPLWSRNSAEFEAHWPACGDIRPDFAKWQKGSQPVTKLKEHNGKRNGWANPDEYRRLPQMIAPAQVLSQFNWRSSQIPGLDILADLENPHWTALVEHLITQRRATKPTKAWQKEALALCEPLAVQTVETRLHNWLALFHTPVLGKKAYTAVCNGERFAAALDRLEAMHGEWPTRHGHDIPALGRAIAISLASYYDEDLCPDFHPELVRLDDSIYKNRSATDGVLHMQHPKYKHADGRTIYDTLARWLRLSVENEEILRGALWLVALMPNRARAIDALEKIAKSAATYTRTGDDGMRSKVIANAAIATLIDLGGQDGGKDIDPSVLRLSKTVEHQTVCAPLLAHLNMDEAEI